MNGDSLLIDTNVALYLLSGNKRLAESLNNSQIYISFITELEL
jgi:predicted nucleic acid-binding protein